MQAHAFFNPFADLGDSFDSQEGVLGFCAELDFFKKPLSEDFQIKLSEYFKYETHFCLFSKKQNFLMGRSAAFELLKNYFPHEALQDLEIINSRDPDDFGKPMIYLKGQKHEGNLSITHSHHLSVAGYSQTHNLGLDLELQKQRTLGFKNKILTDKEKLKVQQLMQNRGESFGSEHFENELLTAYWTVKESIQKIKALGINLSPREIEVDFKVQNISELYQQKFIACFAKTAETFEVQLQLIELNNNERYTLCVAR